MFIFVIVGIIIIGGLYFINRLISPTPLDIKSGHVLITGGSSGIGRALAIEAVKAGANVTILARRKTVLEQAKQEIDQLVPNPEKQKVLAVSVDITGDYDTLQKEIEKAEKVQGPVDMLVNCAGFSIADEFENLTMQEFRSLMEVNYLGTVATTKAVIGGMKGRGRGRVVFVSSQAGQAAIYGLTGYSASKFALQGLAEALQMEVKPYNIYVTLSYPADTDTPGFETENIRKPKITQLISDTSGLFDPEYVAKTILKDSLRGRFLSYVGFDGFMLAVVTAGFSPVTSVLDALVQVCLMSVLRIVSIAYSISFDRLIRRALRDRQQEAKQR